MSRSRERGVTLIELMLAVTVGTIAVGGILQFMIQQQETYTRMLSYSDGGQNARASIDVIKGFVRSAAFGFQVHKDAEGVVAVGACHTTGSESNQNFVCDNVDNNTGSFGHDRLRLVRALSDGFHRVHRAWAGASGTLVTTSQIKAANTENATSALDGHPYDVSGSPLALISGPCINNGAYGADLVVLTGQTTQPEVAPNPASYVYSYSLFGSATQLSCNAGTNGGYDETAGFSFGLAEVVDFYLDRSDPDIPTLMMNQVMDTSGGIWSPQPVAYNIADFQVQYLVDTTTPDMDMIFDLVCDDLQQSACATGLTTRQNMNRVLGVRVAVVPRSQGETALDMVTLTVFNNEIGGSDLFSRWFYRGSVVLRNVRL